ncbi:lipopolysaccharide transport system ATP-binding protein [Nitrosospira multiformis]|uniref:Lipopolysaccharide transport system ATP-binding protein n=1 Tax=Nitrosospira multiformis TaxID=1231 RepID=A0A1I0C8B3_9PROT|nr:ABC transporter ATP-binding protein [Nitrosospira multiformis]SET15038.1 lipopolysaccharide transport system ATP-binding protein [Nitrosospira multiformis]
MFSDTEDIANAVNLPLSETECGNQAGSDKSESAMSNSGNFAVRVQNISKCYQIYDAPRDRLKQFVFPRLQRLLGKTPKHYFREFWALKDVSFEIKKGQTVGIIGRNGSGKSTLLQIICGTLSPTNGLIETNGRIAALLELGSGFNPEFTGRENVYMNAAVLGLTKEEIEARYSDIQVFADIGDFIDQPVKSYSSGMVVRLAFAVAINVAPDILVVDEALSVGDELFQRKCFSRIEAIKKSGATILFVSHAGATVVELCDQAILVDKGEILISGAPKTIVAKYQKLLYAPESKHDQIRSEIRTPSIPTSLPSSPISSHHGGKSADAGLAEPFNSEEFFDPHLKSQSTISYEPRGAIIRSAKILNLAGDPLNCLKRGNVYCFKYEVYFTQGIPNVRFGMLIKTVSGVELGGGASAVTPEESLPYAEADSAYQVEFHFRCSLNPGTYYLNAGVMGVHTSEETYLHRLLDIVVFRVLPDTGNLATGIVDFGCHSGFEQLYNPILKK